MKLLEAQPSLAEQVHQAILSEIASGKLPSGARVIQEQIAQDLGVSRQPVQQALALLRKQGVLHDAAGRGLIVAPLNIDLVRHMYDVRAVIEGLAFRRAAEHGVERARLEGPQFIRRGQDAVASGSVSEMVAADMAFHSFIHELSGNPLIGPAMETHWTHTQRVIGEVLSQQDKPRDVWKQHAEMVEAIGDGNANLAEKLAKKHILVAGEFMIEQLQSRG